MNNHENNDAPKTSPIDSRRPYVRPAVVVREPLEAVATSCEPIGLAKGDAATCPFGPLSS